MMDSESENDDEIHLESVMEKTPEPVAEVQEHEEALSEEHKNSKLKALEVTLDVDGISSDSDDDRDEDRE